MNTIGFSHPSPGSDARQSDAPQQHASAEQADVVAHLPRTGDTEHRDLAHGFKLADRLVQPAEGSITRPDGEIVFVEPKVMEVLLHLARAQGHLVTRRELLDEFWYPDAECDGALTRTVCTLRRDLGDSCRSPRFIHTVHGRGYRLLVPVEPVSPDSQPDGEPRNGSKIASRGPFRKRVGCFESQTMSDLRVIAQNPTPPGRSNQWTGDSLRRRFQAAWG